MIYLRSVFALLCAITIAVAQIPNFGRCPEYDAMPDFDREEFLGKWYEIERYFTVSEVATRCNAQEYERRADGKLYVNNLMINRFTGVQRIVSGVMTLTGANDEGSFTVRYSGPVSSNTPITVLDTDYDSYAVLWSCSTVAGPVGHTESVWLMTRERKPDGPVLQAAYGVLDRYKISRTFFVKTDQENCETKGEAEEAEDTSSSGYDIVVDDDTVEGELFNNQHNSYQQRPSSYQNNVPHYQSVVITEYYRQNPLGAKNTTNTENEAEKPKIAEQPKSTEQPILSSTAASTQEEPSTSTEGKKKE